MLKIVSGGQTGVDRAALDAAIEKGIAYWGWCPRNGWAEDFVTPPGLLALYPGLQETPAADPRKRTEWNVRDSDALLVLTESAGPGVSQGTERAIRCAKMFAKPYLVVDLNSLGALAEARAWLAARGDGALCIAGPRESEAPGIYAQALTLLRALLDAIVAQKVD
ncbi:MAG: putative molybdenum carrier protein [Methyloceanibacter sp.]|uniref:putative molybdenum carrier protein n=1 Tax=Methyloceanibacter sp. TaxID=1965321 RepID=UPI003D6D7DA4